MTGRDDGSRRLRDASRDGLAIGGAVGVVGVVFGVLARSAGLSTAQSCAMSLLVFTGASQFAAVSVIGTGGSALAATISALLLAGRNALYGPVVAPWFADDRRATRAAVAQLIIDESTGIGAAQPDPARRRHGFLAAGVSVYVFWNLGTLLGALAGNAIGNIEAFGLDAAFPSAFLALLIPHLRDSNGRVAATVGALLAAVAVPLVPAGVPVLIAAAGAAVGAWSHQRTPSHGVSP